MFGCRFGDLGARASACSSSMHLQVEFNGRRRAGYCLPKARPHVFVLLRKKCYEQGRSPVVGSSRLAVRDIVFRQQSKTMAFQLRSAGMTSICVQPEWSGAVLCVAAPGRKGKAPSITTSGRIEFTPALI